MSTAAPSRSLRKRDTAKRYDDEDTAGNDCKSVYFESETGVNRALLKTLGGERGDR